MPCGKRPLVKMWDKPKHIRVITPSVLEQNEASVKVHWKKVIRDLELFYKDDQFWESQCEAVRVLVGPKIFHRLAKIFNLPFDATPYEPKSEVSSLPPSDVFYITNSDRGGLAADYYSNTSFIPSLPEEEEEEEEEDDAQSGNEWSESSEAADAEESKSKVKSEMKTKSFSVHHQSLSKVISKISTKSASKVLVKSASKMKPGNKSSGFLSVFSEESARTDDDLIVHPCSIVAKPKRSKRSKNPHFDMLYCNESETDMIKWNSKYKVKTMEVSASDEFSKKAEIMTKKISKEFYDWWVGLGNVEFKSEIKRPEDIEDLFQVWFDEHASRGLVLDPKILPCVLQSISNYVGVPRTSCPRVLKRQIASDIYAETSPEHTTAFGSCLPQKMKHIPPKNNTDQMWNSLVIPKDLQSMAAVWDDVAHLTSTKTFQEWLEKRPHLPMPPCLKSQDQSGEKKQPFVVPSDFLLQARASNTSAQDLALPVSQFELELKEVLSKLMNN